MIPDKQVIIDQLRRFCYKHSLELGNTKSFSLYVTFTQSRDHLGSMCWLGECGRKRCPYVTERMLLIERFHATNEN